MNRFGFVLEQTLGHVAHGLNIERALARDAGISPSVIRVGFTNPAGVQRLPVLRTWSWRASLAARDGLRAEIRREPLDAIFIHTQVAALLALDIMKAVPTVVSLDATPRLFDREADAYGHRRDPELLEMIKHRMNARAFAAATRLVTWCQWAAYSLVTDYAVPRDKIEVIPPGVDLDLFRPSLVRRPSDRVRLLFVGGQFARKGGLELLDAVAGLGGSVEVDIVTGDDISRLTRGLPVRVHRGLKPQSEKLVGLYRSADVFVLPSRGDCMPQAVIEAIACGLPIVGTRVGAIPEMVTEGVNGHLVPARNPRALQAALEGLVKNQARRHQMGHQSRVLAQQAFDAARNNARILDIMKRLATERTAAAKSA